jgi:hypothetical protein
MGGHGSSASLQAVKLIRPLENNSYTQYVISCVNPRAHRTMSQKVLYELYCRRWWHAVKASCCVGRPRCSWMRGETAQLRCPPAA